MATEDESQPSLEQQKCIIDDREAARLLQSRLGMEEAHARLQRESHILSRASVPSYLIGLGISQLFALICCVIAIFRGNFTDDASFERILLLAAAVVLQLVVVTSLMVCVGRLSRAMRDVVTIQMSLQKS